MTEIVTEGPTLQEEVLADLDWLEAQPARTLNRRVGLIMQGGATKDEPLREKIMNVAQGWQRVQWTLTEIRRLEHDLEAEESRLKIWLVRRRALGAKGRL